LNLKSKITPILVETLTEDRLKYAQNSGYFYLGESGTPKEMQPSRMERHKQRQMQDTPNQGAQPTSNTSNTTEQHSVTPQIIDSNGQATIDKGIDVQKDAGESLQQPQSQQQPQQQNYQPPPRQTEQTPSPPQGPNPPSQPLEDPTFTSKPVKDPIPSPSQGVNEQSPIPDPIKPNPALDPNYIPNQPLLYDSKNKTYY